MKKLNYVIYNIMTVVAYFYGIILCATLILFPLGVYSIISANRFSTFADYNDVEFAMHKQTIKVWTIFGCILYFPLGLFLLIPLAKANNNVVVEDVKTEEPKEQQPEKTEAVEVEIDVPKTSAEKQEKLAKLKRFKENGLISEDEYNQAKAQLEEEE